MGLANIELGTDKIDEIKLAIDQYQKMKLFEQQNNENKQAFKDYNLSRKKQKTTTP